METHREIELNLELAPEDAERLQRPQPRKAGRIDLGKELSIADAFTTIVLSCLQHFRANEAMLVERRMPEALHQARVAMRRLRSAFQLFRPILRNSRRYRSLSRDLRWCSRILGETRNLDVFLTLARDHAIDLRQIERRRDQGYARVAAMLKSRRFLTLMSRLLRWAFIGKWRQRASAAQPIDGFAARRLEKAWSKISNPSVALSQMTEERRHRFRLRTKQFRYVLEFLRSINSDVDHRRKPFHATLEALQDDLGALNDMALAARLAAESGISDPRLVEEGRRAAILESADERLAELVAIGPYWRPAGPTRQPEAAAAPPRASASQPAASRRRAPRSAGSAHGLRHRPG